MQLGMIGLGRMGGNMVRRLLKDSHQLFVFDQSAEAVQQFESEGAIGASSLDDLIAKTKLPKKKINRYIHKYQQCRQEHENPTGAT